MNDWEEAEQIWLENTKNTDSKVAGRAHFNMALAKELDDDLEAALDWAKKAYYEYDVKKAKDYIHKLNRRIKDKGVLNEQVR